MISIVEAHKIFSKEDKHELHQEANKKQEYKFVGTFYPKAGMKLFSYNPDAETMTEVIVTGKPQINFDGTINANLQAQYNPKWLYFQAINEKNAWKRLKKYQQGDYSVAETFSEKKKDSIKLW